MRTKDLILLLSLLLSLLLLLLLLLLLKTNPAVKKKRGRTLSK